MSVISTLRDRATTTPSDEAFVFMDYDTKTGDQIDRMTWSQLYSRVTAVSAYLISYGRHADRRRTAAISAPQGLDYVAGFLGALCAGWTPVPLPEPLGSLRDKRTGLAVLDCAADVVLTTSQAETRVRATIATHGALAGKVHDAARGCWRFRWWGGGVGDFGEDGFGVGCSGGSVGAVCAGSAGA